MRHFIRFTDSTLVKDLHSLSRQKRLETLVYCATKTVHNSDSRAFYGISKVYTDGHRHCESGGWYEVLVDIDNLAKDAPGYLAMIEQVFVAELWAKLTRDRRERLKERTTDRSPLSRSQRRRVESSL